MGTHLVTCQAQPALGCVYKLVEMRGAPRIKLSQDRIKISVPCKKRLFRLYDAGGVPMGDVMMSEDEFESSGPPNAGQGAGAAGGWGPRNSRMAVWVLKGPPARERLTNPAGSLLEQL